MKTRMLALTLLLCLLMPMGAWADDGDVSLQEALAALPEGAVADLDWEGLKLADMAELAKARPDLRYTWDVTFGGVTVPGDTTVLDLDSLTKDTIKTTFLRQGLTCLTQLTHVTMFEQKISVKDMEAIIADFPQITFDWSVQIGTYRIRTDATAFSTLKGRQEPRFTARDMEPLKYCTRLEAIDLGHNNVSDLSFLTQWPHLKILIIIDSKRPVTDLTPLAELNELEYVELFMQGITDLTPLANKPNLLDLNLCHNSVTDLTPLYSDTSLERLWISYNKGLSDEQVSAFQAAVPGCQVETVEYQSTGAGWREHERYFVIKDVFETRVYRPFATQAEDAQ
ncbi:MAG: leucine-rich repeat domain-containing protein [Aristaeellaceae bacterium]